MRPLAAQVNLSALRSNLRKARERASGAQVLAVVKADAYGHGLMRVLPALSEADGLALLELDAAVALRERVFPGGPCLIRGGPGLPSWRASRKSPLQFAGVR